MDPKPKDQQTPQLEEESDSSLSSPASPGPSLVAPPADDDDDIFSQPAYLLAWDLADTAAQARRLRVPLPIAFLDVPGALEATACGMHTILLVLRDLRFETVDAAHRLQPDLDTALVECWADRATYRPSRNLRDRASKMGFGRCWHAWEYPELVEGPGDDQAGATAGGGPPVRIVPGSGGELAVVFRRALLWMQEPTSGVLFLDAASSKNVKGKGKARRGLGAASLEDVLWDVLGYGWEGADRLDRVLSEMIYDRWLELFELLEPEPQAMSQETVACYWQILRSLELNEEADAEQAWTNLLSRIQRRIALLSAPRDSLPTPSPTTPSVTAANTLTTVSRDKTLAHASTAQWSLRSSIAKQEHGPKSIDGNQRALDRITYLGGVLIPFPVVAGVLSMGDTFGPSGPLFYVFWAVVIPLLIATLLYINTDKIRKDEVWVEISADEVEPTGDSSATSSNANVSPVDVRVKHRSTVTWQNQPDRDHTQMAPSLMGMFFAPENFNSPERIIDTPSARMAAAVQLTDGEAADPSLDPLPASGSRRGLGLAPLPDFILEKPSDDGSKWRAWKREELGWYGAVKSIFFKKPRAGADVPEGVPASAKSGKR